MRSYVFFPVAFLATSTAGEVFKFPLANGFPNIKPGPALTALGYQAGGPLPQSSSGGSGDSLPKQAVQALQGLAFNELFEVAFFTQLLQNVTVRDDQ